MEDLRRLLGEHPALMVRAVALELKRGQRDHPTLEAIDSAEWLQETSSEDTLQTLQFFAEYVRLLGSGSRDLRIRNMAPRSRRTPRLFDEDPDPTRRGGRPAPLAVGRGAAVRRPRRGARRGRTPDPRPARTAITAPPAAPRYELPTTAPGPVAEVRAQAGVRSHRCPAPGAPGSCAPSAGPSPPRSPRAGRRRRARRCEPGARTP